MGLHEGYEYVLANHEAADSRQEYGGVTRAASVPEHTLWFSNAGPT
jgi:hypothetical protein